LSHVVGYEPIDGLRTDHSVQVELEKCLHLPRLEEEVTVGFREPQREEDVPQLSIRGFPNDDRLPE
jgi:hypothetical protein